MKPRQFVGWDIGGAHLKAAIVSPQGELRDVIQLPCEIWRGMERLDAAVGQVLSVLDPNAQHAITMTAELADLFPDRATGVRGIASRVCDLLAGSDLWVYAGRHGFVDPVEINTCVGQIASANWLATTTWVAQHVADGLLIDIGSTTTDLIAIKSGRVATRSETDAERLTRDELVYTGVVRTPVCALADRVPFRGEWQSLAAEMFASAGDCYRLLNWLPADGDQQETADGRGKSGAESARRLGRMLGRDTGSHELPEWHRVAAYIARKQMQRILDAADRVLSGAGLAADAPVIGAGIGRFLALRMAPQLGRPYRDVAELLEVPHGLVGRAADCFPAVAVAMLGLARFRRDARPARRIDPT